MRLAILTLLLYLELVWEIYGGEDWTERGTAWAVPVLWDPVRV